MPADVLPRQKILWTDPSKMKRDDIKFLFDHLLEREKEATVEHAFKFSKFFTKSGTAKAVYNLKLKGGKKAGGQKKSKKRVTFSSPDRDGESDGAEDLTDALRRADLDSGRSSSSPQAGPSRLPQGPEETDEDALVPARSTKSRPRARSNTVVSTSADESEASLSRGKGKGKAAQKGACRSIFEPIRLSNDR